MKKKSSILIILAVLLTTLNHCSPIKKALGFEKDPPDEFLIEKVEPIEMPPNYDLLPPGTNSKIKSSQNSDKEMIKIVNRKLNKDENLDLKNTTSSSKEIENEILEKIKND